MVSAQDKLKSAKNKSVIEMVEKDSCILNEPQASTSYWLSCSSGILECSVEFKQQTGISGMVQE